MSYDRRTDENAETQRSFHQDRHAHDEAHEPTFDTVGFLIRRKWLIVFGLIVGLSLGYVYFMKQPAEYQSSGRVLVVKQMAQMPISGGVAMDSSIRHRDHLANDMFLIRSRDIVGPAVEENSLQELPTLKQSANPVDAVINGLSVSRVNDTADLLEVKFKGRHPDDCGEIVNSVIRSYRKHLQQQFVNSSNETVNLLTRAKVELNQQLEDAATEYREFRKNADLLFEGETARNMHATHIQSTNGKLADLQIKQRGIEGQLNAIDAALQRGGSREALRLMIDQTAAKANGDGGTPTVLASMAQELFPLLLEEELLLETHGPAHPKVQAIRKKIELTRNFLQDQSMQQNGTPAQPVDFLQVYINSLKLELETAQSEELQLRTLLDEQTVLSRNLSDLELQNTELVEKKARLQRLFEIVLNKLEDVNLAANSGGYYAELITPAGRGYQIAPNLAKIMSMGGILGALFGLLLGYVVESSDQSFKSPEEMSSLLGLQIIGHCPLITSTARPKGTELDTRVDPSIVTYYRPKSRGAEAFRAIRTALYFSTRGANHKVIQITSPHPGDGKSTLSTNLAVTIAQSDKKVVIIDADFRRPRVHKIFGLENELGMSSAINGECDLMDAIQATPIANLDCLACGPRPDNPAELLTLSRFEELLNILREKYDFVLVDTPPVLAVTDPSAVAPRVDGVMLCIRVNNKSRLDAVRATEMLTQIEANILGIVVNGIDGTSRGKYGYGGRGYKAGHMYGYGYGYGYGLSDEGAHPSHAKYYSDDREGSPRRQRTRS